KESRASVEEILVGLEKDMLDELDAARFDCVHAVLDVYCHRLEDLKTRLNRHVYGDDLRMVLDPGASNDAPLSEPGGIRLRFEADEQGTYSIREVSYIPTRMAD